MAEDRALPPLDLLRGFEAAARHLSFTKAAGELFLTQSAVSRQIQALEQFVGVALFERRHKALVLTEPGRAYFRAIEPMLEELRAVTRRVREMQGSRALTVTTTVSFASLWLVPRLARWRRAGPGHDVRIMATPDVVDLERAGIDLAIRDLPVDRAPAGAVYLVGEHLAAVCSPGYLRESRQARRPLARPADLRQHTLLVYHDPTDTSPSPWLTWAAWLEAAGIEEFVPAGSLTYDYYDQVIQAAIHGQGVALARMTLADEHIRARRLVSLFGKPLQIPRAYHAVLARGREERSDVQRFVAWLREEIGGAGAGKPREGPVSSRPKPGAGRRAR